ncbi:FlgB family protein [Amaricoccus sp.]|uniref:FlgB family protein n=1 Tax=Amaricoccus sp. TaxID=1872485 RepID=UPI001B6FAA33|nr:FlgB family protein [Amaricoccus sp.]MBP7240724.1 FlgB family protein [Amaricoccus sp.]
MDHNLTLLRLASSLAAHATARQGLVAENIANADTPGYRTRDVVDFATTLEEGAGFAAKTTRAGHMDLVDGDPRFEAREAAAFGAETPNGNSVSLEDQMVRGAEVRQSHDLALGVYRKTMDILRTSIGKG